MVALRIKVIKVMVVLHHTLPLDSLLQSANTFFLLSINAYLIFHYNPLKLAG